MSKTPNRWPTAGASGGPDPIFAAIDGHRAALRGWLVAPPEVEAVSVALVVFQAEAEVASHLSFPHGYKLSRE